MIDHLNHLIRKVPNTALYIMSILPPAALLYMGLTGALGVDPAKVMEHQLGKWALQLLVLGLAVTPLRRFTGINLIKARRAFGVIAFAYVVLHLLVWLLLDVQIMSQIWADILKRPYITVGMAAFAMLLPLALTSNNASIRKLKGRWRLLHRLAYPAAILAAAHYVMLARGFQIEPILYLTVILTLLALRIEKFRKNRTGPM